MAQENSINNSMSSFWDKIKSDYLAIIIGAIVGIPAMGIVIPKLFSVLSETKLVGLPTLFRFFSMVYFSLPLVLLFILTLFQFQNDVIKHLRNRIAEFLVIISLIFFCFLVIPGHWMFIKTALIILLSVAALLYYVRSFSQNIKHLTHKIKDYKFEINKLGQDVKSQPSVNELQNNITDSIASVKVGVLYLLFSIQLIVTLFFTAFNRVNDSILLLIIIGLAYLIPYIFYQTHPTLRDYIGNKELSRKFIPSVMLVVTVVILFILFISANKSSFGYSFSVKEKEFTNGFQQMKTIDTLNRKIEYLHYLSEKYKYDHLDSTLSSSTLSIFGNSSLATEIKNQNDSISSQLNKVEMKDAIVDKIDQYFQQAIKSKQFPINILITQRADLLDAYKTYVLQSKNISEGLAKTELVRIIRSTQKTGIIIYVTSLLILLSVLLLLYFKDDRYQLENLPEVAKIRKLLQIACLCIGILLLPLVKLIPENAVNPAQPSSIFLLENWNFAKLIEPTEDPGPVKSKQKNQSCCCDSTKLVFDNSSINYLLHKDTVIVSIKDVLYPGKDSGGIVIQFNPTIQIDSNFDSISNQLRGIVIGINRSAEEQRSIRQAFQSINGSINESARSNREVFQKVDSSLQLIQGSINKSIFKN